MPDVVVIIPTYNGAHMLRQAIECADPNAGIPHRLVISDDDSPDPEMRGYLERLASKYTVLYHKGTRGFPHNVNFAVSHTTEPFICLLNSDTRACRFWLREMMAEMSDPMVGIVGAKLIYPKDATNGYGDCIQHCGVARDSVGQHYHIWRGAPRDAPEANERREINAVTFACALIRRTCWDAVGGLDERFVGGQFEDIDFNLSARQLGWKVIYTPKAELYHREHGSGEDFVKATAVPNRKRLRDKWPNLTSDERLFMPFSWDSIYDKRLLDEIAGLIHGFQSQAVAKTQGPDGTWHGLHYQDTGYIALTEKEKKPLRDAAREVVRLLQMTYSRRAREEGERAEQAVEEGIVPAVRA
jgi:GT2 family glycosyltransferase